MKTLLRIDSSARAQGSHSRELANRLENQWKTVHPQGKVIYKDLLETPLPHIQNNTIEGFHALDADLTEELKDALRLSNELIGELKSADEILISSPLYNLNIPSSLKAYLDHVVRFGHTFTSKGDGSYKGLLNDKTAYLALAKGSVYKGTEMEILDHQESYLKVILQFIGIEDIKVFSLEGTAIEETCQKNLSILDKQIQTTF